MAFVGIEFKESEGGGIALISHHWLTPRKKQIFWPPYKTQEEYLKALKSHESHNSETWTLYNIERIFFEEDDLNKGLKKIKQAEVTSNLSSDDEELTINAKRSRKPPKGFLELDSEEESPRGLCRPPAVKLKSVVSVRHHSEDRSVCPALKPVSPLLSNIFNTPNASRASSPYTSEALDNNAVQGLLTIITEQNREIATIKEQTKEILSYVRKQATSSFAASISSIPEDIPVQLPLNSLEDVNVLDEYLRNRIKSAALCSYFTNLGGRDGSSLTNNIMKHCFTYDIASLYNFYGKRSNKQPFSNLNLKGIVVSAVRNKHPERSEKDVEQFIKEWLKHSPQRAKLKR